MLIISLVFSLILAWAAWGLSRRTHSKVAGIVVCLLAGGFCLFLLTNQFLAPAFALQICALGALFGSAKAVPSFKSVLIASALCYVPSSVGALAGLNRNAGLLASYPFESLRERTPEPRAEWRNELSMEANTALGAMEYGGGQAFSAFLRTKALERLHASQVVKFINSQGFGVARTLSEPTPSRLKGEFRDEEIAQAGAPLGPDWSPREALSVDRELRLSHLHRHLNLLVEGFAPLSSFGLVRSREQVAGFQPHQFNEPPHWEGEHELRSVELVSLLLHEQPAVYVSANLPRMKEVGRLKTRPLDPFEAEGLVAVRNGQEMFAKEVRGGVRLLGAIRAAKQCVDCHAAQRGDLLGAFSYSLVQKAKE